MLIAVILIRNIIDIPSAAAQASTLADGLELRLDYAENVPIEALSHIREALSLPVIFTLRSRAQGGHYKHDETQRLAELYQLATLKPDYMDIEYDVPEAWVNAFAHTHPEIKLIRSYHNFHETPTDLDTLFKKLYHPVIHTYKIATYANSTTDALRMMHYVSHISKKHRITGLCMGIDGQCTRILGPVIGSAFYYAAIAENALTAPGQLTLHTLCTTYRLRELNRNTSILALLGDPINGSIGHILHNKAMINLQKNVIYVKLRVSNDDLANVIALCRTLPFAGFSVTMPLKENILPFLDTHNTAGTVNTVVVRNTGYHGYNTDGLGAMSILARHCLIQKHAKSILIIGAGGAARAIAFAAKQTGARVTITNRTALRATLLAEALKCSAAAFEPNFMKKIAPDCVINTLPDTAYNDLEILAYFEPSQWDSVRIAMEIVYQPRHTTFLRLARAAKVKTLPGIAMFIAQARLQLQHWFEG